MTDFDDDTMDSSRKITVIEFVAIPDFFDIEHYLSIRESTGFVDTVDLKQMRLVAESIRCSTIFTTGDNYSISATTIFMLLQIYDELKLVINLSTEKPWKPRGVDYKTVAGWYIQRDRDIQRDTRNRPMSFIIINLLQLQQEGILEKALQSVVEMEEYVNDLQRTFKKVGKLD
jgi:hypothetical protein